MKKTTTVILKILNSHEFKTFLVALILGLSFCYGLKKFEQYGRKLAEQYNKGKP